VPGSVDLWQEYLKWKDTPAGRKVHGTGLISSPETIRRKLRKFEESNIDQVILLNQAGQEHARRHLFKSRNFCARSHA